MIDEADRDGDGEVNEAKIHGMMDGHWIIGEAIIITLYINYINDSNSIL